MLTNILSASTSPTHSGSAPHGQHPAASSGPSFASLLNTEMTTAPAAPTPPVAKTDPTPVSQPASAASEPPATPPTTTATANSNGAGSSTTITKKNDKTTKSNTDQTDSAAQAAAATAATLAAVAAGINVSNAAATTNAANVNKAAQQAGAADLSTGTLAGESGKIGTQPGTSNDPTALTAGTTGLQLNAVGAKSTPGNSNPGQDRSGKEFTAAFGKALDASTATSKTNPVSAVANPVTAGASTNSLTTSTNVLPLDNLTQNIQTANDNLSSAQMNAMAPILSAPNVDSQNITASATITPQVGSPAWDQAIGQKINWMVAGGQQSATLTLNPPNLGPMQIVLSLNNQHASATFIAHQPEVRAALEHAIPKLREMMEQSGIELGQCNVNSQAQQQQQQQQASTNRTSSRNISSISSAAEVASTQSGLIAVTRSGNGLVDTFV